MKYLILILACLTVCPGVALAQCGTTYRTRTYSSYSTYVAPTYVAPVAVKKVEVVKEIVPVFLKYAAIIPVVEFPTYGAYYAPPYPVPAPGQYAPQGQPGQPAAPGQGAQANGQSAELRQILDLMRSFDERLRRLEEKSGKAAPMTEPKKEEASLPDVRKINASKCALCHQAGNEASGGKFILSDAQGQIARLNNEQLLSLSDHVYAGTMPKLNARARQAGITALSDAEAAAWMREITRQRKLNASLSRREL